MLQHNSTGISLTQLRKLAKNFLADDKVNNILTFEEWRQNEEMESSGEKEEVDWLEFTTPTLSNISS